MTQGLSPALIVSVNLLVAVFVGPAAMTPIPAFVSGVVPAPVRLTHSSAPSDWSSRIDAPRLCGVPEPRARCRKAPPATRRRILPGRTRTAPDWDAAHQSDALRAAESPPPAGRPPDIP